MHLFGNFKKIEAQLKNADKIFLASDYDGTLTPIVKDPKHATLDKKVRSLLKGISKKRNIVLSIISGRSLKEIKKLIGIKGVFYAGNHGFEIEGPGLKYIHKSAYAARDYIKDIKAYLSTKLIKIKGVIIEDKNAGLSLHYRKVKTSDIARVRTVFRQATSKDVLSKKVKVLGGKKVLEVRPPVSWNKAKAVKLIKDKSIGRRKKCLTIYLGDDLTDEDVFGSIKGKDISIYVGKNPNKTKAKYFLKNVLEVKKLLGILENPDG